MTKASVERRLRALESDQPKSTGLGTLPDPLSGQQVSKSDLFDTLSDDELLRLEAIVHAEMDEGQLCLGPRAVAFLSIAFERVRARKELK